MSKSRTDTWMPLYWGDYLRDTGHLGPLEHGVYLLLIGHYWTVGHVLPADDRQLARIARATPEEWAQAKPLVQPFFEVDGETWRHGRIERELEKWRGFREKKARAGRASGAARGQRNANSAAASVPTSVSTPVQTPVPTHDPTEGQQVCEPSPSPSPVRKKEPLSEVPKKADPSASSPVAACMPPIPAFLARTPTRGSRLPPEFAVPAEWLLEANAIRREHGMPDVDADLEARKFVDFWHSKSGAAATKVDWHATWRNWVRNAKSSSPAGSKPSSRAGIDAAFAKLEQLGPVNLDHELLAAERRRKAGGTP